MKIVNRKCKNCGKNFDVATKLTFLGFPKMVCPECNHKNIYPLSGGYKRFYIAIIVLGVLLFCFSVATGRTFMPGWLLIVAVVALYYDGKYRNSENLPASGIINQSDQKTSFCRDCGVRIKKNYNFCPKCGNKENQ